MSAPFWAECVCRKCSKTTAGRFIFSDRPSKGTLLRQTRDMANEASRAGWIQYNDDWLCQKCGQNP